MPLQNVGFIGLGMMGLPMAKRLLRSAGEFSVFNRTKLKADVLVREGAVWRESPAEVAAHSEIVFTMVTNPSALGDIALGQQGLLSAVKPGGIHIDTSTVSPAVTRQLSLRYGERGAHFLHAPVLGSIPEATDGTLLMFAGGDEAPFRKAEPLLNLLSKQIWRFERPEQATHLKLICNLFIAGMITTLGQALVFARKSGVDQQTVLNVIGQSRLSSPMYQTKGGSIIAENFAPRFYLDHMLKDINLMLEAAQAAGAPLPAIRVAQQLFVEAQQAGLGREDYSAVVKAIQMRSGK